MKISGFTFARNTAKLHYPIAESIRSILPICDEFIVALGKGDDDDTTRDLIEAIGDPKIKIIDTVWTDRDKLKGKIHSQQSNIALDACSGDWCCYIQADEVVHEDDLPKIKGQCEKFLERTHVDGLLFDYLHFWGDYDHFQDNHTWYPNEIRVIRNRADVRSWNTAQSFRKGEDGKKLTVAPANGRIFHYGWARPPRLMQSKEREFNRTHQGEKSDQDFDEKPPMYDYGSLETVPQFTGTHPAVMKEWIEGFDWAEDLQYTGPSTVKHKHDRLKPRLLTWIEKRLLGGRFRLGAKRWRLVSK